MKTEPSFKFTEAESPVHIIEYVKPQWHMIIGGKMGIVFHLQTAPNAFHRFAQRLILGFKWEKIEQKTK